MTANTGFSMIGCPLRSNLISIKIHSESLWLHALYQIGTVFACFSACPSGLPYSEHEEEGLNRSKCKTQGHKGCNEMKKPPTRVLNKEGGGVAKNIPSRAWKTCNTIYNVEGSFLSLRKSP